MAHDAIARPYDLVARVFGERRAGETVKHVVDEFVRVLELSAGDQCPHLAAVRNIFLRFITH